MSGCATRSKKEVKTPRFKRRTWGTRRKIHLSLSRYSPGTSSWGTSWVWTSFPLASPASCTPFTASASNAFPSSSNSSTLSESAASRLDNPCKSPDCPLERGPNPSGANATVSTVGLFPRTGFLAARAVFRTAVFLAPAFVFAPAFFGAAFFASFALSAFLTGFTFLPAVLLVCFFLVFFLATIGAVYHRSAYGAPNTQPHSTGSGQAGMAVPPSRTEGTIYRAHTRGERWRLEVAATETKSREIPLCAGRPVRRNEPGRKNVGLLRSE